MSEKPLPLPLPVLDESVWYSKGLRFQCTQCGNCCSGSPGYVYLTPDDMQCIADFLQIPLDTFTRTYVRQVAGHDAHGNPKYSLVEKFNYDCTFLKRDPVTKKSLCMIYPVRPTQCRTWPFWNENLKAPAAWKAASAHCPGMCASDAPVHDLPHIESRRQHPESPK